MGSSLSTTGLSAVLRGARPRDLTATDACIKVLATAHLGCAENAPKDAFQPGLLATAASNASTATPTGLDGGRAPGSTTAHPFRLAHQQQHQGKYQAPQRGTTSPQQQVWPPLEHSGIMNVQTSPVHSPPQTARWGSSRARSGTRCSRKRSRGAAQPISSGDFCKAVYDPKTTPLVQGLGCTETKPYLA